jgi:hypothetical protein
MNEIKAEALRLARVAVKLHIRHRGLRLKDYALKDINRLGEEWFAHHPELMEEATGLLFRRGSVRNPPKFRTLPNPQASKAKEFSS